jgi:uncharacterized RmlC-like cupin family protein
VNEAEPVVRITANESITAGPAMPGMIREQAIATDGLWAGLARTEPGMDSGWHHHGDHESAIYVLSGSLRMESGPGGASVFDAEPGDFLYVPRGAIHRELNLGVVESQIIVARAGHGPTTTNVEGPAQ